MFVFFWLTIKFPSRSIVPSDLSGSLQTGQSNPATQEWRGLGDVLGFVSLFFSVMVLNA